MPNQTTIVTQSCSHPSYSAHFFDTIKGYNRQPCLGLKNAIKEVAHKTELPLLNIKKCTPNEKENILQNTTNPSVKKHIKKLLDNPYQSASDTLGASKLTYKIL
ncbi:MAG: hypothetical protein ACJARD_001725 [Alphaproteobacteria bacterium]